MKKIFSMRYMFIITMLSLCVACEDDEIKRDPIADFDYRVGPDGLTITFINDSKDTHSFVWDFGDGATSTEASPVHTYATLGDYNVKIVATSEDGPSDEFAQTVKVPGADAEAIKHTMTWPLSAGYSGGALTFTEEDWEKISETLELSKDEVLAGLEDGTIQVVAIEPDGNVNTSTTAIGFGHWFDKDGFVASWGDEGSRVFAEWHLVDSDEILFGHRPDHPVAAGDVYTVKQALQVGEKQARFIFTIEITAD